MQLSLESQVDVAESANRFTVSEIIDQVKNHLEPAFAGIEVEGEISNFSQARSGHCYFTLKDEDAQLQCVMWRSRARRVTFAPEDGMLVRARGDATVYASRGQLQMQVSSMQLAGEGALQQAFEELKSRLKADGLFDPEHKKPLPPFPDRIGVVTSGEGAALHDILSTLRRRFPCVEVQLHPVPVQGTHAAPRITEAINHFNEPGTRPAVDLIIIGRGGGSLEDLWAFNEESVARAVYASEIPVISAVGHETDFAITDFVADMRAATPSIAAEVAVPDRTKLTRQVQDLQDRAKERLSRSIRDARAKVKHLSQSRALHRPVNQLRHHQLCLDELIRRLERATNHHMTNHRHQVERLHDRLQSLHPSAPLSRGYALVSREDGAPVSHGSDLRSQDIVNLHFADSKRTAQIIEEEDASSST